VLGNKTWNIKDLYSNCDYIRYGTFERKKTMCKVRAFKEVGNNKIEIEFNPNSTDESKSGKTILLGTSRGAIELKGGYMLGYNIYKRK
jgi:hypothetical protein